MNKQETLDFLQLLLALKLLSSSTVSLALGMAVRGIWEAGGPPQALLGNCPQYPALELRCESSSQISHSDSVYSN